MKAFSCVLILLFSNVALGEDAMSLVDVIKNDTWSLAEGEMDDHTMFLRFRTTITKKLNLSAFPKAIHIFWDYKSENNGMPSSILSKNMEEFENRITDALEGDQSGILTVIKTYQGTRQWLFYTTNTENFSDKLHNMPQNKDPYPIEIEAENDEEWEYFFDGMRIPH